jgi:uncharacterized protein (TIGR00369 family)
MEIGESFGFDDPQNRCFGCSPHNPRGLQLRFTRTGERTIETVYTAEPLLAGGDAVVHGGIQAALLDETMGIAAHLAEGEGERFSVVTAELHVRYRRPVPVGVPLTVRAVWLRSEPPDIFVEGAILAADGTLLTGAEARWRRIGPGTAPGGGMLRA